MRSARLGIPLARAGLVVALMALVAPAHRAGATLGAEASETGCPAFWDLQNTGGTLTGDLELDGPGPFGNANLRLSGAGLEVADGSLTATIRVRDMRRQVTPGFTQSGWQLGFFAQPSNRFITITALYHLASDAFTFHARVDGTIVQATGTVRLGVNGSVAVTVPLVTLKLVEGTTEAASGFAKTFAMIHYVHMTNPESGISTDHHSSRLPQAIPIAECPGASIDAVDRGRGAGIQASGHTLPIEAGHAVTLERSVEGRWEAVGSTVTDEDGWYFIAAPLPPGHSTVRVAVETHRAGTGHSPPVTVLVT
ncbi:MAG: hypothetical protein M3245_01115 [Actinomycetota bacterium]|nr:hypothetical protein [Actinomycetota bacterium]